MKTPCALWVFNTTLGFSLLSTSVGAGAQACPEDPPPPAKRAILEESNVTGRGVLVRQSDNGALRGTRLFTTQRDAKATWKTECDVFLEPDLTHDPAVCPSRSYIRSHDRLKIDTSNEPFTMSFWHVKPGVTPHSLADYNAVFLAKPLTKSPGPPDDVRWLQTESGGVTYYVYLRDTTPTQAIFPESKYYVVEAFEPNNSACNAMRPDIVYKEDCPTCEWKAGGAGEVPGRLRVMEADVGGGHEPRR